ncbi:MAG: hypothetical protein ACRDD7_02440, partial [Peptostreptococcaceae bacterium]
MNNKLKISNLKNKRRTISSEEALKYVVPIKWTNEVLKGESKVIIDNSKVDVFKFLSSKNIEIGVYALVSYEDKKELIYFSKYNSKSKGEWFLESPCQLYSICKVNGSLDIFAKEYATNLLEEGSDIQDYIDRHVKPMIVDGVLYEIENFQCSPYLPKEVDR